MTNIYVGNLSFRATEADLSDAFSQYGAVSKVSIIMDRETGRSRGFGFVEMGHAVLNAQVKPARPVPVVCRRFVPRRVG